MILTIIVVVIQSFLQIAERAKYIHHCPIITSGNAMIKFTVQVEDSFVQTLGYETIEKHLHDVVQTIALKFAAQDIVQDLETLDLTNDKEWQAARNMAWQQEQHKYFPSR
jgi:hypothetical protein